MSWQTIGWVIGVWFAVAAVTAPIVGRWLERSAVQYPLPGGKQQ